MHGDCHSVEVSKILLVQCAIVMGIVCLYMHTHVLEQLLVDSQQVNFILQIFP